MVFMFTLYCEGEEVSSKYEILEDAHETSVYKGNELIAVFFDQLGNTNGAARAQRFVDREEYLEQVYAVRDGE